jgi:hypothetical protein
MSSRIIPPLREDVSENAEQPRKTGDSLPKRMIDRWNGLAQGPGLEVDFAAKIGIGQLFEAIQANTEMNRRLLEFLEGRPDPAPAGGADQGRSTDLTNIEGAPFFKPLNTLYEVRRFIAKARFNNSWSISVGTTAQKVAGWNRNRITLLFFNNSGNIMYIGGVNVTTGTAGDPNAGFPMQSSTGLVVTDNVGEWYAVSGSASQDLRMLEMSAEL